MGEPILEPKTVCSQSSYADWLHDTDRGLMFLTQRTGGTGISNALDSQGCLPGSYYGRSCMQISPKCDIRDRAEGQIKWQASSSPLGQQIFDGWMDNLRGTARLMGLRCSGVKNPLSNAGDAGDTGSSSGSGRFPWRREWQPTPVFLPGESHGQRRLESYRP